MSGGVDSAVAALLSARGGRRRGRGDARAVGRPDERRRALAAARPQAVRGARALAHGMGLPHLTLDLRDEFRAGVVDAVPRRARRGPARRTRACAATATCASTRCSRSPTALGADDARHRPLRARRPTTARAAAARRRRPGQGPELHARRAGAGRRWRGCASRSGELTQAARCASSRRARPGCRSRDKPDSPGPLLPRRHRPRRASSPATAALGERARARSSTGAAACSAATAASTRFTVGQRRGLGVGGGEPLYVLATDAAHQPRHRRPARGSCVARTSRSRGARCTATAPASTA